VRAELLADQVLLVQVLDVLDVQLLVELALLLLLELALLLQLLQEHLVGVDVLLLEVELVQTPVHLVDLPLEAVPLLLLLRVQEHHLVHVREVGADRPVREVHVVLLGRRANALQVRDEAVRLLLLRVVVQNVELRVLSGAGSVPAFHGLVVFSLFYIFLFFLF